MNRSPKPRAARADSGFFGVEVQEWSAKLWSQSVDVRLELLHFCGGYRFAQPANGIRVTRTEWWF